MKVVGQ